MKQAKDFIVTFTKSYGSLYGLLRLRPVDGAPLPEIMPGQFVQVATGGKGVFLRRPISINNVDKEENTFDILVRRAGDGTEALLTRQPGDTLNVILPLGNGFPVSFPAGARVLLIGGGVGVAPLLYLAKVLKERNVTFASLLGARSKADLLMLDEFKEQGDVYISTEDGTEGDKGFVTQNNALTLPWDVILCCGPAPMMKAVASIAKEKVIECYVSLENMMACGLGACLCCVENTVKGNVCVCTEGPVFNINQLNW